MEEGLKQKASNLIKIVLFGPESTGKTTLAKALARHFNTFWVGEYMRPYLQKKWDTEKKKCQWDDLIPIAQGQMELENQLTEKANQLLFLDTNLLELYTYIKYYYNGDCPSVIKKYAFENRYHFYFFTYIDVPWESDDLRDRPNNREDMFERFHKELKEGRFPYHILKGSHQKRLQEAIEIVERLIKDKQTNTIK